MSLPPLNVKIGADTRGLDQSLNRSQQIMRRFALGAAGALAAVGTAMVAMTRRSMQNADELAKSARQIGLTTDRLQAMQLVAQEAGISTGALTNSLGIMQRNIVELERGTAGQTRAFEALGLSIRDLQGLNADEQFERIAERLNRIEDPAQRTAIAMEVFGRSGREVINMLDGYSDKLQDATEFQRRFGIAIEQTDAEAIERANDAVGRLREAFGGLGNVLAVRFAPAIERASNMLLGLAGHIADRVNPQTDTLAQLLGDLPGKMDAAANAEPGLSGALANLGSQANETAAELGLVAGWLDEIAQKWRENQALGAPQTMFTDTSPFSGVMGGADADIPDSLVDQLGPVAPGRPSVQTPGRDTVRPRAAPAMLGEPLAIPSIGGGSAVADQFAGRLEALQEGLQTEGEVIEAWYQESLAILDEGLDRRLMTEEEYLEARERLEEEYARRSNQIERLRNQNNFQEAAQGMSQILNAVGQGNERMMRISKAFNAGMAWIDTLAGAARELRKGTFGFATAAAVIAKGAGFVAAINSSSTSSRGSVSGGARSIGAGGGGASSGGGGMAAQQQAPTTTFRFTIQNDSFGFGEQFARQMIDQLNEAQRNGGNVRGVLA
jgi:hypothetical protein